MSFVTHEDAPPEPSPGARQLSRGITATWWYTVVAVGFLELFLVLLWALQVFAYGGATDVVVIVGVGGLLWWLSTFVLLARYRRGESRAPGKMTIALALLFAVAYGAAAGASVGSWLLVAMPIAQSVVLIAWPRGIRIRVVTAVTIVLVILAVVDGTGRTLDLGFPLLPVLYAVLIPVMSVSSLWWWDVLVTLDRARRTEGRLGATQERLRLATDVHDLQGHHLQVIALQLELAERLMERDPAAALEQLRLARASVDDARQGTRDLATRFRTVPLGDELANARDLLGAAGLVVEADIATNAGEAPADALGPIIRETTTNVLRHGGGVRARLSLHRVPEGWRYEITNDADGADATEHRGSGLEGLRRRIAEVGGTFDVHRADDEFTVAATVPAGEGTLT